MPSFSCKNCFVEGAVSQIVGKANEDTYSIFLGGNHSELKGNFRENFTMIGVFDGHGGAFSSKICAERFRNVVLDIYEALLDISKEINIPAILTEKEELVKKLLSLTTREEKGRKRATSMEGIKPEEVNAILVNNDDASVDSINHGTIKTYSVNAADDINSLFWHYNNDIYLFREDYIPTSDIPTDKNDLIKKCSILTDTEKEDALLCAAVHTACKEINSYICSVDDSGTTMVCIMTKYNPQDDSTKVYCINVGDSRAVMLNLIQFDENYSLDQSTSGRITRIIHPISKDPLVSSHHSTDTSHHSTDSSMDKSSYKTINSFESFTTSASSTPIKIPTSLTSTPISSSPSMTSLATMFSTSTAYPILKNNYMVTAHLMSEDHKLTLKRERERVLSNKAFAPIFPLPLDASSIFSPKSARQLKLNNDSHSYGKYPLRLQRNNLKPISTMIQQQNNNNDDDNTNTAATNLTGLLLPDDAKLSGAEIFVRIIVDAMEEKFQDKQISSRYLKAMSNIKVKVRSTKVFHEQSFIIQRTTKDGSIIGPEALCGRHNISMMMTRSIGDIYGPRSCVETADISSFTVPNGAHARFILGSDGFWDVVSVESTRCMGFHKKYSDPGKLAKAFSEKALRRRLRSNMRIDDITVAVIDINPANMQLVAESNGGCDVEIVNTGLGDEYFGPKPSNDPSCFTFNTKMFSTSTKEKDFSNSSTRSDGSDKSKNSTDSQSKRNGDNNNNNDKTLETQIENKTAISQDRDCVIA